MEKKFKIFVSWFLKELYGSLAYGYDIVAFVVSFGNWNYWTYQIKKFLNHEDKILEVGIGTGILHKNLINKKYQIYGCDLSEQMIKISSRRLKDKGPKILRTNNINLPFKNRSFTKSIGTFPSEYIFSEDFLNEAQRLLKFGGELIVLLSVSFVKNDLISLLYRNLYKITGQSLSKLDSERVIRDLFGSNLDIKLIWEPYKNVELCFVTLKSK
jgi:ubiquinone/menaquinone biosynthesis C-methylase UbiE